MSKLDTVNELLDFAQTSLKDVKKPTLGRWRELLAQLTGSSILHFVQMPGSDEDPLVEYQEGLKEAAELFKAFINHEINFDPHAMQVEVSIRLNAAIEGGQFYTENIYMGSKKEIGKFLLLKEIGSTYPKHWVGFCEIEDCGNVFFKRRANSKYCSRRCTMKGSRLRKAQAQQHTKQGETNGSTRKRKKEG